MTPLPLFSTIEGAFRARNWHYTTVVDQWVVESLFDAYHTKVRVHVQAFPEIRAVSAVGYASGKVPPARQGLISEMLMRLNQQLTVGNFEMDYDSGSVFFRTTNLFETPDGSAEIISGLVHSTIAEVDRLTPFLTLLLRMPVEELSRLNLKLFLQREDLLPPVVLNPSS